LSGPSGPLFSFPAILPNPAGSSFLFFFYLSSFLCFLCLLCGCICRLWLFVVIVVCKMTLFLRFASV